MAEGKEYISRQEELGSVNISEEVLAVIAGAAAMEVDGVSALGTTLTNDVAALVTRKSVAKGVHLEVEGEAVMVDVTILVKYGYVVPEVAKNVQDAIQNAVMNTSGLDVSGVNVTVSGVTFQK
ncbi:Asp23/Gls24 family envelope stress response protein [Pseudoflavonifractor sp. SW1122]|uniref:Asp23/Gls24 family envelope stress response protein n=1 Tax=Pseudoflavonifractor sp. SW1122 TaxID=2530044 RepID=UPI001439E937|nr:Asp23/Gls24 family envelope stress response protein [Pseudoflavonifractor sp. SW1122]NJE73418.1 Asp23/Gls24 family envelope stress response protein [Pseudoflavonifractor sp. SW1122]